MVTLTNTSGHALSGPLALVLEHLPAGVAVANATGAYRGHPFVEVLGNGGSLTPHQHVTVTLRFLVPAQHRHGDDLAVDLGVLAGI
jgi:hypothetical protein